MKYCLFLIVLGAVFLIANTAHACFEEVSLEEVKLEKVLPDVYAIGLFQIKEKIDKSDICCSDIILRTLVPYSDFMDKEIKVSIPERTDMCEPFHPNTEGGIYELILVKRDNSVVLLEMALEKEEWDKLNPKANYGVRYKIAKALCQIQGKKWKISKYNYRSHYCENKD